MISCYWFNGWTNAGDLFTPYMLSHMGVDYVFNDTSPDFVSTGSILTVPFLTRTTKIWGSGLIKATTVPACISDANVYAVRGYLTKKLCGLSSCAVGDPGLLASRFYQKKHTKVYKYGIIPHMIDATFIKTIKLPKDATVIDICTDNFDVLFEQINQCEFIISSSLHGIIFSHSFGIPAFHIICNETVPTIDDFKFKDYYSVWKLPYVPKHVKTSSDMNFTEFDLLYRHKTLFVPSEDDINSICDGLMKTFPL